MVDSRRSYQLGALGRHSPHKDSGVSTPDPAPLQINGVGSQARRDGSQMGSSLPKPAGVGTKSAALVNVLCRALHPGMTAPLRVVDPQGLWSSAPAPTETWDPRR